MATQLQMVLLLESTEEWKHYRFGSHRDLGCPWEESVGICCGKCVLYKLSHLPFPSSLILVALVCITIISDLEKAQLVHLLPVSSTLALKAQIQIILLLF